MINRQFYSLFLDTWRFSLEFLRNSISSMENVPLHDPCHWPPCGGEP